MICLLTCNESLWAMAEKSGENKIKNFSNCRKLVDLNQILKMRSYRFYFEKHLLQTVAETGRFYAVLEL